MSPQSTLPPSSFGNLVITLNFLIFRIMGLNAEAIGVERHLHALMCSVTVVFIHTMEDDQRLNTLVHEGDTKLSTPALQEVLVGNGFTLCFCNGIDVCGLFHIRKAD